MPDYKGHNEPLDSFSAGVKARMENHRLPVDTDCWNEIEAKMQVRPRRKAGRIGLFTVAAAAIALLLLLPLTDRMRRETVPEAWMAIPEFPSLNTPDVDRQLPFGPVVTQPLREWQGLAVIPPFADEIGVPDDEISLSPVDLPIQAKSENVKLFSGPEPERRVPENYYTEKKKPETGNKRSKWLLATAFGTGGRPSLLPNSLDYAVNDPSYDMDAGNGFHPGKPGDVNTGGKPQAGISPEQYKDADYAPTLSVGFIVRKNLNKRLALESGLVYSYLYTKLHGLPDMSGNAKLGLHYLGIPVNLVVNLWDDKRWNIYLSGGPMVEKGLRSIFRQEIWRSGSSSSVSEIGSIDGLQWSLNFSAGAAYRFLPDWSLYLEPRFSYYFDNYQPRSIRTDKSSVIGINAGVRFEF